jgi:hypothetical protein
MLEARCPAHAGFLFKAHSRRMFQKEKCHSPSGNRTPVSRVTGGDTHHYTNEEKQMPLDGLSGASMDTRRQRGIQGGHRQVVPKRAELRLELKRGELSAEPGILEPRVGLGREAPK